MPVVLKKGRTFMRRNLRRDILASLLAVGIVIAAMFIVELATEKDVSLAFWVIFPGIALVVSVVNIQKSYRR